MTEFVYQVDKVNDNLYFIGKINNQSVNELTKHIHNLKLERSNSNNNKCKIITKEWLVLDKLLDTNEALEINLIDEVI